ncbi:MULTISPECIES: hypothetical protein [unclassified Pseudoalteromonas]|uniref:hypothetical protein n=1 Tax=unclassified Pseudoalteromonas TaxID=194690 RepID=UPI000751813A|nr:MULTISPECIES: hypothetical protein [unclassified Pseudoalteromonas]
MDIPVVLVMSLNGNQIQVFSKNNSALLIDDYKDISIAQNEGILTEYNIADLISNCLKTKENQITALNITIKLKCDTSLIFKTCNNLFSQVLTH